MTSLNLPSEDKQKGSDRKVAFCPDESTDKSNSNVTPLGKNMAPKRIHTRRFSDPNPPKVVENPERILRRSNTQAGKGIFHLQKSLSLPAESVKSAKSFSFDKGTDQSLSRSKSSTELSQAFASPERPNLFKPAQQPSHPSSTSLFP